jgi:hypothetical protein
MLTTRPPKPLTDALKQALCVPYFVLGYRSPVPLPKFQMAPIPSTLLSFGSKRKETRQVYLSGAYRAGWSAVARFQTLIP